MSAEESIYDLIPRAAAVAEKKPLYRSTHNPKTPPTATSFGYGTKTIIGVANFAGETALPPKHKQLGATLGPPAGAVNGSASLRLRGSEGLPSPQKFTYSDRRKERVATLPASPRSPDGSQSARGASRDFVKDNKSAAPAHGLTRRVPAKTSVDYTKKPDYGKAPAYLDKVKQSVEEEREAVRKLLEGEHEREAEASGPKVRQLDEQERLQLLAGLKEKWNEVNKKYQQMTHLVLLDTLSKLKKKENFETQLAELERAMDKLGKSHVFVADE